MDLNTIEAVLRPVSRADISTLAPGDAWLAGGTWLFSEPQRHLRRLIDLSTLRWPDLEAGEAGLSIAATCPVGVLEAYEPPPSWRAGSLFAECCRAFWASFKIRTMATVGGNLCLALPAGPMIALVVALEGECLIWMPNGDERRVPASDFVIGPQQTVLRPGEVLRRIDVPDAALRCRAAFRQTSRTPLGRSAALVIGTRHTGGALRITITASTPHPVVLAFDNAPTRDQLKDRLDALLPLAAYFDDPHGSPEWRRHLTQAFAEEIRSELSP